MLQGSTWRTILPMFLGIVAFGPGPAHAQRPPRIDVVRVFDVSPGAIQLGWLPVPGATGYEVLVQRGKKRRRVRTTEPGYMDAALKPTGKYRFKVRALSDEGKSRWSPRVPVKMRKLARDYGPPVLENLLVDLADPTTLLLLPGLPKNFVEFGGTFEETLGSKTIPAFEFFTPADRPVLTPVAGLVRELSFQDDSQDYEIEIARNPFTMWSIVIDHVSDPQVQVGDHVRAGDVVGVTARYLAFEGVWRTELEVSSFLYHHCPFSHFDPETRATYEAQVSQVMAAWEAFSGDTTVYDEAAMAAFAPGCRADRIGRED